MTTAFAYRARRSVEAFQDAKVGETIRLDERVEYALDFGRECLPPTALRLRELGGDLIGPAVGVLAFGNFVGLTELAGVKIEVTSTKIGEGGVSRLLQEVSELAAGLLFGWRSPVVFGAAALDMHRSPIAYHQLQFLRRVMLGRAPGERLQDWLAAIERSPTRRFEPERPVVNPDRVRRMDPRAVRSVFSRLDRLIPVPAKAPIAASALATALTFGLPPEPHFPCAIAAPRGRLSFDTPENRFVKHVIRECLALVHRFADHPRLHASLRQECRIMLTELEQLASARFLGEVGRLAGFTSPSQALAKANGYRQVCGFWSDLTRHISLPRTQEETTRLLEGRDMATLYEYWVFLKVVEAVTTLTGRAAAPPRIRRDDLGETLILGLRTGLGPDIEVRYNPTYQRSDVSAYSTPLRPDVVLEIAGHRHAFDAKYRLDRFDVRDTDADDGAATYKRADLYKMHTYRDAIAGLETAFVVYPGTEFVFFERTGFKRTDAVQLQTIDGVGAIPLRPADGDPAVPLRRMIAKLLSSVQPLSAA